MLSINMTDVINVLKLIAPHLIALLVVLAAAIVVMIAVRKKERAKKFMIRRQALIALLAAIVTIANLICFGPMSNMITLATGKGEVTDKTIAEARELSRTVAGEGIVLLENKGLLPLATGKKLNVFGWSSVSPYYGGTGSGGFSPDFETNTLLEGLESAGFETNKELSDFYRAYRTDRPEIGLFGQDWTLPEPPLATYSDAMMENAKSFSDTAVIVIARSGGEGADLPKDVTAGVTYNENSTEYSDFSAGQHILQLDKTERDLFDRVCADFSNVIVVYTGANTFEMTFVDDYPSIKGLVWCQGLGQGGFPALGSVLSGSVNPSGKTSDTFARNIANSPWFNNFGNYEFDNVEEFTLDSGDPILGVSKPHFVNYVEGIYVGYRFYETAAVEGLIDYDKEVQYPFGYGLSYTTFEQTMGDLNVASDGNITVDVTVTNTGSVAGKDAVELYDTPPYTNGGIEKAAVNLVAFDKTKLLEPGESQTLTLSFTQESLASYDANVNKAYVLEEGEYVVSLRTDSHTVVDEKTFTVGDTIVYGENNKRSTDEVAATNHFDSALGNATYLSRADHFANFTEATASPASYSMTDEAKAEYVCNLNYDPTALNDESDEMPVTGANNGLVLEDLRGADYDDPRWEKLLDELTVDEMVPLIGLGGYQTIEVSSVKKARTTDCDGPASITNNFTGKYSIGMPSSVTLACTFNKELALEYGRLMGKMCDEMEASGWYAPAINTHRAALGGREFEYVSEDGILSGTQIAQEVIGAKEYGVYSYIKHFAMNDQETNRWNMVSIWAPEQAIREIYLKPFEIAVKTGGAQAVMSSYSYIGPHWSGANDSLLNKVLRDEWGFRGMVITDYFLGANFMDADACIRNGNDLMLVAYEMGDNTLSDQTSATGIKAMRTAAKNIMYTVVNSRAYEPENLRSGLYGWQIALIIADLVVLVLLALWEVKTFKKYKEVNISK
ncbi:glycoside hydrolase family 3 C-terminal domain-containing protein [Butyrivibrio sp. MC2021]|uniref:glycoside hydrolase family 3 C-terminal domain-containing protein n=1 Tax=Butyrivibrio sp. MC2021 TaxID=1408306 RepID=UPI00047D7D42|nr:glycoside hydrolase family 3 C-terminal domain-containing protein [Butyrivibrio sp. MC2021]